MDAPTAKSSESGGTAPSAGATSWTEVRVDAPLGWSELVAEALSFGPCTSVVFGTTSIAASPPPEGCETVRTYVAAEHDTEALRDSLRAALARLAASTGAPELSGLAPRFKALPPEDYATSWRRSWKPFRAGRFVVRPAWLPQPRLRPGDLELVVAAGSAFGSGRHASTRTVLRVLGRIARAGDRVLDAGSGSGILGVAACRLGARSSLGFDIDPMAAPDGARLAAANGVGSQCEFRRGDFSCLTDADAGFDLVLANIYADVLAAHAADFRARLAPGGRFVFSGCRADHVAAARAAFERARLRVDEALARGRWWTFTGAGA